MYALTLVRDKTIPGRVRVPYQMFVHLFKANTVDSLHLFLLWGAQYRRSLSLWLSLSLARARARALTG
jgi:hypothetical protein